jgi:hypothetical protein
MVAVGAQARMPVRLLTKQASLSRSGRHATLGRGSGSELCRGVQTKV